MNKKQIVTFLLSRAPKATLSLMRQRPDLFAPGTLGDYTDAGIATTDTGASDWLSQLSQAAQKLLPVYQQQQIFDANVELARQGKPLISASQLAPQFNVGLSNTTLFMLAGLAALFLIVK